jgi:protease I
MAEVAFVVADDFEDAELQVPYARLRAAGHHVRIVGARSGESVRGKRGAIFDIEMGAADVDPRDLDAVVVPGGYSPDRLRLCLDVVDLVRRVGQEGRIVAAICHGPSLLIDAELVQGRTITSWPSIRTDLEHAGATWVDEVVVEDGNLITSRNPDDLEAFSATILRRLPLHHETRAGPRARSSPAWGPRDRIPAGEEAFLDRLRACLASAPEGQEWIGDDAAVLEGGLLFATDALVEGVHFDLGWCAATDVGWKALAVNLSDIAAMGGTPFAAVAVLVVPPDRVGLADGVIDGVATAAGEFDCPLVGGDTTGGPVAMVSVAVLGRCGETGPVLRRGARSGDAVFVTGPLGAAAVALAAYRDGRTPTPEAVERLHRPTPRLREGMAAAAAGATAMIDLSDGLANDLSHVCEASHVGVRITGADVPLATGAALADAFSGDDYELCFTASDPELVTTTFTALGCRPPTRIGTVTAADRILVDSEGRERPLPLVGWEHTVS